MSPSKIEYPAPLQLSGTLNQFDHFQLTPCIGTEFKNVDLAEWLRAETSDDLIRDLAILIAQRGVVFFRHQTNLNGELHKELLYRLGALSGRPEENGLYIHPLWNVLGEEDPELATLDPDRLKKMYGKDLKGNKKQTGIYEWHSDMSFELNPPDFSSLRLTELPPGGGGDTIWASGYEVYDRLSVPYQKLFDSLEATHSQQALNSFSEARGKTAFHGPRGSPANVGTGFRNRHPVVRTHPITGWKSVFAAGVHCEQIHDVSVAESVHLLKKVLKLIAENPDLQVRFRWENENDIAIWDNRCTYHAPIQDQVGRRRGFRVLSTAEKPYLDPASQSRQEYFASLFETPEGIK
ncbi:TfdA family taurine catabolism dioxygenase TauD [Xylona heveae TC161]|uniref:TfdA family taurine catabolism dioxygenase TauD n=1 Tax=Xylona heveae (strain CBS 132557 / TC161) TaxID=1328760 RepID=A0A165FH18_XYLHT|nr:TfdA family taurine catabolism dioxygenase TauD [Xylona heveae TC161]KZF20971.1 TfdA family taurine catabolism dioxygenase TauD [Xylona heveae TC161]